MLRLNKGESMKFFLLTSVLSLLLLTGCGGGSTESSSNNSVNLEDRVIDDTNNTKDTNVVEAFKLLAIPKLASYTMESGDKLFT
jgi:hypothetical protein